MDPRVKPEDDNLKWVFLFVILVLNAPTVGGGCQTRYNYLKRLDS
jgi:hypothetical protein